MMEVNPPQRSELDKGPRPAIPAEYIYLALREVAKNTGGEPLELRVTTLAASSDSESPHEDALLLLSNQGAEALEYVWDLAEEMHQDALFFRQKEERREKRKETAIKWGKAVVNATVKSLAFGTLWSIPPTQS